MALPDSKPQRTFVVLTASTLAVFAALVFSLTTVLRNRLRGEICDREAQSIHDVATMEITQATNRLKRLGLTITSADIFAAVLDSSRLHGVLAVQLFDATGSLRDALPAVTPDASLGIWWAPTLADAEARYHANAPLEQSLGLAANVESDSARVPLLEVVVPLREQHGAQLLGIARYWVDGSGVRQEFRHLDQSFAEQAGLAFGGGAILVVLLLIWSYRRLMQAHQQLVEQREDLARANQELDFAAKTGALGAISAHLIHGLKNPLAGLEGFVTETADVADVRDLGEARQSAVESARRLRAMVNDVVSVLRDEASGDADYRVPAVEMLEAVKARAQPAATRGGVQLEFSGTPEAMLLARTANLASLVLANLLTNAIDASRRGTTIRVNASDAGSQMTFLVTDEAGGLPSEVKQSLFRPVISTKPGGGGIGLAISARLARHAGGELSLARSDEKGTVFRLAVPIADAIAASAVNKTGN